MFIGHYGPAFAGAALEPKVKLWHMFAAVQLVDIAWAIFILAGIEHMRVIPGFTAANPFDLYHMPYTHSLVMSFVWAAAGAGAYFLIRRGAGRAAAIVVGLGILSHWFADLIVHTRDLELWIGGPKVGLGLWHYREVSLMVEIAVLVGGVFLYQQYTEPSHPVGEYSPGLFMGFMIALQAFNTFGPPPPGPMAAATTALLAYFALIGGAAMLDYTRKPKSA